MSDEEIEEILSSVVGKELTAAAVVPECGVLMLCFPEGKTLYVKGGGLSIELEAAN